MTLNNVLTNTAGRFTTLIVTKNNKSITYCAKINSASTSMVSFYDVNAEANRRVKTSQIAFARSGNSEYRKAGK
jgi:hypothetical protein